MWGTLFGGGQAANKKKQDAAKNSIVKLREQVNMLEKKETHLQKQIDDLTATAKRNVTTNKKGTLPFPSPGFILPSYLLHSGFWLFFHSLPSPLPSYR
jgi:hypothetical protein